nr:MAG TPA: hypothetical protein [Caudoviricetes sp.]
MPRPAKWLSTWGANEKTPPPRRVRARGLSVKNGRF